MKQGVFGLSHFLDEFPLLECSIMKFREFMASFYRIMGEIRMPATLEKTLHCTGWLVHQLELSAMQVTTSGCLLNVQKILKYLGHSSLKKHWTMKNCSILNKFTSTQPPAQTFHRCSWCPEFGDGVFLHRTKEIGTVVRDQIICKWLQT